MKPAGSRHEVGVKRHDATLTPPPVSPQPSEMTMNAHHATLVGRSFDRIAPVADDEAAREAWGALHALVSTTTIAAGRTDRKSA
jgi:hypothetical protein